MPNQLAIQKQYPTEKYNLLGNTSVVVDVPEIKKPVIQSIKLDPDPDHGDVYKFKGDDKLAISKNGLKKLADGAGIKMISSEHVLPATCQKCAAVNAATGRALQCGNCTNQDVAYRVTIGVPQLTGEILPVMDTHEIIVDEVTASMTPAQKAEFMKHLPQICEAKALNGAIRTALHIKGTYTRAELQKPFVVAYLIPNLDHEDVKRAAISEMFNNSRSLFGNTPSVQHIESSVPDQGVAAVEAADGENLDKYIDGTYADEVVEEPAPAPQEMTEEMRDDYYCDKCGDKITKKVWDFSIKRYERPLCYKCQRKVDSENGGGRR